MTQARRVPLGAAGHDMMGTLPVPKWQLSRQLQEHALCSDAYTGSGVVKQGEQKATVHVMHQELNRMGCRVGCTQMTAEVHC